MEPIVLKIDGDLSARSLREIAGHYEHLARLYRARAAELDGYAAMRRQTEKHLDRLANTPAVLDGYLDNGLSFENALSAASAATGIIPETLAHYWKERQRVRNAAAVAKRAQTVLTLTRQGKTQVEIAGRLGIHPKSVSRILSKALNT